MRQEKKKKKKEYFLSFRLFFVTEELGESWDCKFLAVAGVSRVFGLRLNMDTEPTQQPAPYLHSVVKYAALWGIAQHWLMFRRQLRGLIGKKKEKKRVFLYETGLCC